MKNIFCIAILAVYAIFGISDCYADEHGTSRWRKPFLMPLLLGFYLLRTKEISLLLVLALLFGWAGDTFLLKRNHAGMVIGASSFFAGHLCYMILFGKTIGKVSWPLTIPAAVLYACSVVCTLRKVLPHAGKGDRPLISIYMCGIHFMSLLALPGAGQLLSGRTIMWIGTLFFLVSDTLIAFRYVGLRDSKGVMETYLAAETLIVIGSLL
jgi:uncharacterized membrane protein YhhN